MPQSITLAVSDDDIPAVVTALCQADGYTGKPDVKHAQEAVVNWIVQTVQNVQASQQAPPPPPPERIKGVSSLMKSAS